MRTLRLRQLEEQLAELERLRQTPKPRRGWIRSLRESLGMEAKQLARRTGVSPTSISEMEQREADGAITLTSLKRVANAMNADLVYALVPRVPLSEMRRAQAARRATELVHNVSHTMALEAQSIDKPAETSQIAELTDSLLRGWSAEIWDTT